MAILPSSSSCACDDDKATGTTIHTSGHFVRVMTREYPDRLYQSERDELNEEIARLKKQLSAAQSEVFRLRNRRH